MCEQTDCTRPRHGCWGSSLVVTGGEAIYTLLRTVVADEVHGRGLHGRDAVHHHLLEGDSGLRDAGGRRGLVAARLGVDKVLEIVHEAEAAGGGSRRGDGGASASGIDRGHSPCTLKRRFACARAACVTHLRPSTWEEDEGDREKRESKMLAIAASADARMLASAMSFVTSTACGAKSGGRSESHRKTVEGCLSRYMAYHRRPCRS